MEQDHQYCAPTPNVSGEPAAAEINAGVSAVDVIATPVVLVPVLVFVTDPMETTIYNETGLAEVTLTNDEGALQILERPMNAGLHDNAVLTNCVQCMDVETGTNNLDLEPDIDAVHLATPEEIPFSFATSELGGTPDDVNIPSTSESTVEEQASLDSTSSGTTPLAPKCLTCQICKRTFNSTSAKSQHMNQHKKTPITCEKCLKTYKFKSSLDKHIRNGKCLGKN